MRALHALALVVLFVGCLPKETESCYCADDPNKPREPGYLGVDPTASGSDRCYRVTTLPDPRATNCYFDATVPDAMPDAMPDAEPACSASKACENPSLPVCKAGACVSCDDHASPNDACAEINAQTPVCDAVSGACLGCLENATCTTATASRCNTDTNTCDKCEDSTQGADVSCSHVAGLPFCIDGECKACESDADCPDGEDGVFVCNVLTHTCTDRAPELREYCQTCVSETDCVAGSCVEFDYEGAKDFYCLPNNNDGCKANGYPSGLSDAVIIASSAMVNACKPFGASCEAMREVGRECALPEAPGTDPEGCGRSDVEDEAYCVGKSDNTTACSVLCSNSADCPFGRDCINARQRQDLVDLAIKVCDF